MIRNTVRLAAFVVAASIGSAQTPGMWEYVGTPGLSAGTGLCAQIALDPGDVPYISYQDATVLGGKASVQCFQAGAWSYVGAQGSASVGIAWYNRLAFDSSGAPVLACRDYGVGGRISVRKYSPALGVWNSVGPSGASPDEAHYTQLAVGANDRIFAIYADRGTVPADRGSAMVFDPLIQRWTFVGPRGFTNNGAGYENIAVDSQGNVYCGYADADYPDPYGNGKASVMRYNAQGAHWQFVGQPGFTQLGGLNLILSFDRHDMPYIAYLQYHQRIVVEKFDGLNWVQVGGSASGTDRPILDTEGWRQWLSLAFDSQDQPYVAYQLYDYGDKAAVRRFDGSAWQLVGANGFTTAAADYMALALGKNDVPYVVFRDGANAGRLSVMRYAPTPSSYCSPLANSQGCSSTIATLGQPSTSNGMFVISASNVLNQKSGMLLYGYAPDALPFHGGTLCLQSPIKRTPIQFSGGTQGADDCSGSYAIDFNALAQSGNDPLLVPGTFVFAQYWYRDPGSPGLIGLSDAVRFSLGP